MFRKLLYPFILSLLLSLAIANLTVADLIASYDFEDAFKNSSGNDLHGKPHGDATDVDGIGLSPENFRKSKVLTLHKKMAMWILEMTSVLIGMVPSQLVSG